ncbi:MAG: hypothetical protein M1820_008135 [Bogoriella megaspora]|nr:MAG: hypothetical protein M1820_008135 [Bogoriella megaspora]
MEQFSHELSDGRTLCGKVSLPPKLSPQINAPHTPLIVGVHGGTYSAEYFDACPSTSVTNISNPLSIPVVSISRPGYAGSTALPLLPAPSSGKTFIQQQGQHLHNVILPFLWSKYGEASGANSIVLFSHSIGSAISIVASSLHATDLKSGASKYPLSGLITSGIGSLVVTISDSDYDHDVPETDEKHLWPTEDHDARMLSKPMPLCPPEVYTEGEKLNNPMNPAERRDIQRSWWTYWEGYAGTIEVPHLYGMAEFDGLWEATQETVDRYMSAFKKCARAESSLVLGAPHCMELSYAGRGWMTKGLGFAVECAVWWALKDVKVPRSVVAQ